MKEFQLIIFDLDGTLYDRNRTIDHAYPVAAVEIICARTGQTPEEAQREFEEKRAELKSILKGSPTSTLTLLYFYGNHFAELEKRVDTRLDIAALIQPDPRMVQTLTAIRNHYPIFLYTTNNGKTADRILNALGAAPFFPAQKRFSLSDVGRLPLPHAEKLQYIKPGAKGFHRILDQFGVTPANTLMVGDSEVSDIQPALALGLSAYRVEKREDLYRLPGWLEIPSTE